MFAILIIANNEIEPMLDYLNSLKLTDVPCYIVYLPCYGKVKNDRDDGEGFATYMWGGVNCMYVAGDYDWIDISKHEKEKMLFKCIAHEYVHHIQYCEGRKLDEEEAERR